MSLPTEEIFIQAISHEIRRQVLRILAQSPQTFTDLLTYFDISSSKLTYHLKQIQGFIAKDANQLYTITPLGIKALEILSSIQTSVSSEEQPHLKEAYQGQKVSKTSIVMQGTNILIATMIFILAISTTILIIASLQPETPWYIYPISIVLILLEGIILFWAIRARKSTPQVLATLKKHYAEPL
jgi:DNA-binding transcriptional ArsR family regulator